MSIAVNQASRQVLVEDLGPVKMTILEGKDTGSAKLVVEGKVGQCDFATANGRFYPRTVMEREVSRLQDRIASRSLFASVDHPSDGKSRIRDAGAICVGLRVESNGVVIGRYEVIEGTAAGGDLAAVIRAGGNPGMSSRGIGSTRMATEGYQVVGEDFRLYGYDFVSDPACGDAYPKLVAEGEENAKITEGAIRSQFPGIIRQIEERARSQAQSVLSEEHERDLIDLERRLRESVAGEMRSVARKELQEDFSVRLVRALQRQRSHVEDVVRSELLADPRVAGAKKTLDAIAEMLQPYVGPGREQPIMDERRITAQIEETEDLKRRLAALNEERAGEIDNLRAEFERKLVQVESARQAATQKAKGFGFALYVERALAGRSDADSIREMVGDPAAYDSINDLQASVKVAIESADRVAGQIQEQTNTALVVERHKVDIAKKQATIAKESVEHVREKAAQKIEEITLRFDEVIKDRDSALADANDRIFRMERALQEASMKANMAEMTAYADRRTLGHPRRNDIMSMVESGRVSSREHLEEIAEQLDIRGDEPGGVSERVRRSIGKGRESPSETERHEMEHRLTESRGPSLNGIGVGMAELRQLAGIDKKHSRRF
jgi:hypothetical protein